MSMKFRAHETFFIRKGWISKGMKYVSISPDVFISKEDNPMDVMGIGANMVKSLRYWLQAIGVTQEPSSGKRTQALTPFGQLVFAHDKYIEEIGTLYLLHYKLASNKDMATSWYYFFNEFSLSDFSKDDFSTQISNYIKIEDDTASVALRSIEDDFTCIINTYVPRYKTMPNKISAENNIDCPFGEMGLIDIIKKEKRHTVYKKVVPSASTFNPWVILAVINDNANGNNELKLSELLTGENNIGRIFNLDSIAMLDILHDAEKTGEIKIVRTAGMDIIHLAHNYTFEECVEKYYQTLENLG